MVLLVEGDLNIRMRSIGVRYYFGVMILKVR